MNYAATIIAVVLGCLTLSGAAGAAESEVPEPFRGFNNESQQSIAFDDLNALLNKLVIEVGPSSRVIHDEARDITGTRLKPKVNRYTMWEGNRFHYQTFKDNDPGQQYLQNIQKSLEQLPSDAPLENFSRDEQLAYWLNLYNITVLNEVIAAYPKRNLKKLIKGSQSILDEKLLTVAGIPLSLNDIQFTILQQNYDGDPLILYGLYQGIVGGPDIRRTAYNGGSVYHTLEENAFAFINSNRGTFAREDEDFRVSAFYDRNRAFFPDFEPDLTRHLLTFIEGTERDRLLATSGIKANIDDFTITDIRGHNTRLGGSMATNQAALMDAYRGNARNIYGGVKVATLRTEREEEPEEEVKVEDLERFPVKGADIEEIAIDEGQSVD